MESQGLILDVSGSDIDADAAAALDVLVGGVLHAADHVLYLEVVLPHARLAAYQTLQVPDCDELATDLHVVWLRVSADVVEHAHVRIRSIIVITSSTRANEGERGLLIEAFYRTALIGLA